MTKMMTMKNIPNPSRHRSGFTLIEMLVVAALIAIFAGLAVFNIVEQLNREKEKAAIAECRSIATALSFAHSDLGFYPKLCWLKFGRDEFIKYIADNSLPATAVDWFGLGDGTMPNRIKSKWGEKYMSGSMPDKRVTMVLAPGGQEVDWPADPFNQPYMAYLIKIDTPANNPGGTPVIQWANDSVGDKANYFAGIVSYGRNKVPGYAWNDTRAISQGAGRRLYIEDATNARRFTIGPPRFNQANLDAFIVSVPNPATTPDASNQWTGTPPNMRDAGSDDKYFEF